MKLCLFDELPKISQLLWLKQPANWPAAILGQQESASLQCVQAQHLCLDGSKAKGGSRLLGGFLPLWFGLFAVSSVFTQFWVKLKERRKRYLAQHGVTCSRNLCVERIEALGEDVHPLWCICSEEIAWWEYGQKFNGYQSRVSGKILPTCLDWCSILLLKTPTLCREKQAQESKLISAF